MLIFLCLQKQAMLVRQLEEELRMRMRNPSVEMQQQMEMLFTENEHLTREIAILRETIKVSILLRSIVSRDALCSITAFPVTSCGQ
jgi:hypothetical protein